MHRCAFFFGLAAEPQNSPLWDGESTKRAAAFTHLCDLLLEGQRQSGAAVGKGPGPVGHVLQPLDDKWGRHIEREIPYDVEVGWIFGIKDKRFFVSLSFVFSQTASERLRTVTE